MNRKLSRIVFAWLLILMTVFVAIPSTSTSVVEAAGINTSQQVTTATAKVRTIKVTPATSTLKVGAKLALKTTVTPKVKVKVTWKSSNTKVATVSTKGVVTAKAAGTVYITAKAMDGSGKKATCKIVVKKPVKIVYWTPNGTVYHLRRSCSSLSRSRTVLSGTIAASHKPRACKICG